MKSPLLHLANIIYDQPLAVMPEKLDAILRAIGPRLSFDQSALQSLLSSNSLSSTPKLSAELFAFDEDAQEEQDEKPYKLTDAGVAIVPIRGALMKRGGWMQALSGTSSYETIGKAFSAALRDPLVSAVLLQVDSPGGTTNGCFELSDLIYNSRGDKPIWGCADDMAGSAAYALISSCDHVCLTRTAAVGSIGVFALHCDQSQLDEKVGAKYTYIFAGDKKVDGNPHEPLSRTAKKDMQAEVDRQYEIFVTTVARNRDSSRDKVRGTEAGVAFADSAIPLLADQVATFDETLAALTKKVGGKSVKSGKSALASRPESCNNVAEVASEATSALASDVEGDSDMAALDAKKGDAAPDMKKGRRAEEDTEFKKKKAAKDCPSAAAEDDDEDEEDTESEKKKRKDGEEEDDEEAAAESAEMEDEDEVPEPKKKSKKKADAIAFPVAADRATEIAELCAIAGMDDLTGKYIRKGYSVEQVRSFLQARRAKLSAQNGVSTSHSGQSKGGSGMSIDDALQQARNMALSSNGIISMSKAMETILMQNPKVYDQYDEERDHLAKVGSRSEQRAYVLQNQVRITRALGLSTMIDDVPTARQM